MTTRTSAPRIRLRREMLIFAAGVGAIAGITVLFRGWLDVRNPTVVALLYLLVVLLVAAASTLRTAVATSLLAVPALNYFFLPPVSTFTIADPENWVALIVFLAVSVIGSRLSVIARDRARLIDEREEVERARQSAELKSALLSSLGHDLKTPLTAITVAADNLRASLHDGARRQEQVDVITQETARLSHLFQNIVEMARIQSGAVEPEPEWVLPIDLVEAALQASARALANHRVAVDAEEAVAVRVDPRLTSAALAHVLENAGQHTPAGTAVTVRGAATGGGLALTVHDDGPGLAGDDIEKLLARRDSRIANRQGSFGTGMGLAITRGLVEAQGGRLTVEDPDGRGARVSIVIPAETRPVSEAGGPE